MVVYVNVKTDITMLKLQKERPLTPFLKYKSNKATAPALTKRLLLVPKRSKQTYVPEPSSKDEPKSLDQW